MYPKFWLFQVVFQNNAFTLQFGGPLLSSSFLNGKGFIESGRRGTKG